MKVESYVLLFVAVFSAVTAFFLWIFGLPRAYITSTSAGTIMLSACGLLGLLPGAYYLWWSRRMSPRPEDDPHARPDSGTGAVGSFPSSSIWPFVLGIAAALVALSLVFGAWSALLGIALAISAVIGVIGESRRGGLV